MIPRNTSEVPTMPSTDRKVSATARWLGYSGLCPFVALAALSFLVGPEHKAALVFCLLAYGGAILSFLGAIHWGFTMRDEPPAAVELVWGVLPSLLAWISLLVPVELGLLIVTVALAGCFLMDARSYPRFGLSHWLPMRLHLTLVAGVSTLAPALFGLAGL